MRNLVDIILDIHKIYLNGLKNIYRRMVKSTKYGIPWKVVYTEQYKSKSEAYRREMEIKSYKSGILFKKLLKKVNFGEVA